MPTGRAGTHRHQAGGWGPLSHTQGVQEVDVGIIQLFCTSKCRPRGRGRWCWTLTPCSALTHTHPPTHTHHVPSQRGHWAGVSEHQALYQYPEGAGRRTSTRHPFSSTCTGHPQPSRHWGNSWGGGGTGARRPGGFPRNHCPSWLDALAPLCSPLPP